MPTRTRRGLAAWITSSLTPLFVLDHRRVVLVFNAGCEQLTGWPASEVIGRTCEFHAQGVPNRIETLTSALCPPEEVFTGQHTRERQFIQHRDGTSQEWEIEYVPLSDPEESSPLRVLGIILPPQSETPPETNRHLDLTRHLTELSRRYQLDRLVAQSLPMRRVAAQIEMTRNLTASVHFIGESGVGKEHIARLIHYSGPDANRRFLPIRCGQATHYEISRILQQISTAEEMETLPGTVYVENVDRLPRDLQVQVVDLLPSQNCRWMSSSLCGLDVLTDEQFDPRLRFGLTLNCLSIPSLRERRADLLLLAQQLLEETNLQQLAQREGFSAAVEEQFLKYTWPGNVTELAQVILSARDRAQGGIIDCDDLPREFAVGLHSARTRPRPVPQALDAALETFEKQQIEEALRICQGNKSAAADMLGVPRAKLYRRMAALNLDAAE